MNDAPSPAGTSARRALRFLPAAVALVAAGLTLARYLIQGTGNVYTDVSRTFYVKDPLIGWSATRETWLWVGLEVIGLIAGIAFACLVGELLARRLQRSPPARATWGARVAVLVVAGNVVLSLLAVASLALPIAAFASGMPPAGAEAMLPDTSFAPPDVGAAGGGGEAREASLAGAISGSYHVVAGAAANLVVVQIAAGGENFDARFKPVTGSVMLDTGALEATSATLSVPSASIDAGIALRSKHAKDDLLVERYPEIAVDLAKLEAVDYAGLDEITFAATAKLRLLGDTIPLPATGSVKVLSDEERAQLGVTAQHALLVNARLEIPLTRTKLDPSDYDDPTVRVTTRLVLGLDAAPSRP